MNSSVICYIASAFQVASLYLMLASGVSKKDDELYNALNDEQKDYYKKVVKERSNIFLIASLTGLLVCLILHYMLQEKLISFNTNILTCIYVFTYFIVQYFVYTLLPKKHWMLNHIMETVEEGDKKLVKLWLKKYKFMKLYWHIGLVLGLIAFGMYSYYFLN